MSQSPLAQASPSQRVESSTPPVAPTQRLMSIDALRGFDMFWIIGADALVYALSRMAHGGELKMGAVADTGFSLTGFLAYELEHADWQGFHFYDLIFPLFVFIMGVSMVFSLTKTIQVEGRAAAAKRIFRRSLLLFTIALIYSGGVSTPWPDIRLMGVLNRIALCYLFASLLFCFCNVRTLVTACVALLVGYWAIMSFVPIRDIQLEKSALEKIATEKHCPSVDAKAFYMETTQKSPGHFEKGFNVANHFDFQYLPGRLYDTYWDPEGLLSTLPAIATCLLGVFAGLLLRNPTFVDQQKVIYLLAAGIVLVNLGWLWGLQFPVIKKIWTSSYVLVAGGYSALLLGIFYLVVDVLKYQKWCQPFVWMGMNSITIYMTSNIIGGFRKLSARFVGGDVKNFFDTHLTKGAGDLLVALGGLALAFWFVNFLYRKKIFLRL